MVVGKYDVAIIGGGAGGIATAASLLKRNPTVNIAVIEPRDAHQYQPGLTLVGGGVFQSKDIVRPMRQVMPAGATWIKKAANAFSPDDNRVTLSGGDQIEYRALIVSPGLSLNWEAIEGLTDTLGRNGVTSNYAPKSAPYTWELVQNLKGGRAVFSQPPMPIKCAGAPQKALYLACSEWERSKQLSNIDVEFRNAGGVLFGVSDYVPELEVYMERYGVAQHLNQNLVAVDGSSKTAWFEAGGKREEVPFDMLHVCPPQVAPEFVRQSELANEAGWVDVSQETLQHSRFENIYSLGDVCSTPNAKTAAAVRKQAPVVAVNVIETLNDRPPISSYDGYGSCPLTVERGKVVLAEFGYGGKLLPSAPSWLLDGTKPSWLAWQLKTTLLPSIYFELMLKGREWLAKPNLRANADVSSASVASTTSP